MPPYSDEQGGFVCNIAIDRYATARVELDPGQETAATGALSSGESALALAALKRAQLQNSSPVSLRLTSNFPIGAGLGGSSAAGVASLGALLAWQGDLPGSSEIAELSRSVEVEDLGVPGGRQDHYAAAYGGALGLGFSRDGVNVQRVELSAPLRDEIERRFLLLYTGQSRISGDTITAVLDGYKHRVPSVCTAIGRMRDLARTMPVLLGSGALDDLAAAVGEQWIHQRSLHPKITTELIDRIMNVAHKAGALAGKAMGASGGGCVLLIARSGAEQNLRAAVSGLAEPIAFRIDTTGLVVQDSG